MAANRDDAIACKAKKPKNKSTRHCSEQVTPYVETKPVAVIVGVAKASKDRAQPRRERRAWLRRRKALFDRILHFKSGRFIVLKQFEQTRSLCVRPQPWPHCHLGKYAMHTA